MNINIGDGESSTNFNVYQLISGLIFTIVLCSGALAATDSARLNNPIKAKHFRISPMQEPTTAEKGEVGGLPLANGRTFATLDAYLAYLEKYAAPIDRSWYREIRPDIYQLETGNLRDTSSPRIFTRAQLESKFGFER
jgi:hypothetical protein